MKKNRGKLPFIVIWFYLLLCGTSVANFETTVQVYTDPKNIAQFGQVVRLYVEIERRADQQNSYRFPDFKIQDAIVLQPEQLGTSYSRNVGGHAIVGYRQKFVVIPKRAGKLIIPSITIEQQADEQKGLTTPSLELTVSSPVDVKNLDRLIVASNVSIKQWVEPALSKYKTGDTITRFVEISADDTFGMTLPPALFEEVQGLARYTALPNIESYANRGVYQAKRVDKVIYTLEESGDFILPKLEYEWWDTNTNSKKAILLPTISFNSSSKKFQDDTDADSGQLDSIRRLFLEVSELAVEWLKQNVWIALICSFVLPFFLILGKLALGMIFTQVRTLRQSIEMSEWMTFNTLLRHIQTSDHLQLHTAFWIWIEKGMGIQNRQSCFDLAGHIDHRSIQFLDELFNDRYKMPPYQRMTVSQKKAGLKIIRSQLLHLNKKEITSLQPLNPRT